MPRFYFDVVLDGATAPDETGTSFPDVEAARKDALIAATEMARGLASEGNPKPLSIIIRDEIGRPVTTVRLSLEVESA
jgi:hypothetical protein